MPSPFNRSLLAAVLAVSTFALAGCASSTTAPETSATSAESPTPTTSEPPSEPVVETTLRDDEDGTAVTPLAIVTDFTVADGPTSGVVPVLVKVRVEAGDVFDSQVFPSSVSITRRDADLDYVSLGMSNPDDLAAAMSAAGYSPLSTVPSGETVTAWIGAWVDPDVTEFDLVYNRAEGTIIGGTSAGEKVPASRSITPLTLQ
jgi:hypothetical protein